MPAVFVLIDALGWTWIKDREFVNDLLPYRREVQTVLGFSSGAIPALLTGMLPRETGHWNLFYFDPKRSPFKWVKPFTWLPKRMINNRFPRRAIRIISQRLSRFGGYFQIYGVPTELLPFFDICEKEDIYEAGGVDNSIFDLLQKAGVKYRSYSYHQFTDEQAVETARKDLREGNYDFYFIYLSELDNFLHHSCNETEEVEKQIRKYDGWLRELYAEAKSTGDDLSFFVMSDHGMTPKREGFDLIREIKSLGLKSPKDYIALFDSTMGRFWFFNDEARKTITAKLNSLSCGHILTRDEERRLGIDFDNNRFGDSIFLMNPGVLVEPSFYGNKAPNGMHGFHPEQDPHASAVLLSNRPPTQDVRTLLDVHEILEEHAVKAAAKPVYA